MTTPTDRPNLDRLRELDKAAHPAPWWFDEWAGELYSGSGLSGDHCLAENVDRADGPLIAAYRNATPALVAALTDVLALADEWERDEAYACQDANDCVRCTTFQRVVIRLRRAITNHVTPDAPASEATETKD